MQVPRYKGNRNNVRPSEFHEDNMFGNSDREHQLTRDGRLRKGWCGHLRRLMVMRLILICLANVRRVFVT